MSRNSLQAIPELWLITTLCFCGILDTSGAVICHGNKAMSPGPSYCTSPFYVPLEGFGNIHTGTFNTLVYYQDSTHNRINISIH